MRHRRRRQVLRWGWSRHCSGVCSRGLPRWRTGSRLCSGCLSPQHIMMLIADVVYEVSPTPPYSDVLQFHPTPAC